jgi:O-antigen/teichoic acid export membrane protein
VLSPAEVGVFALASKLSEALSYLPQGISLAVFADMARCQVDGAVRIAAALSRICLLSSIILSAPVYLFFTSVLPVFVPSAERASGLLPLMLAASVLVGPIYLLCSFAQAIGEPRDVLAMTGVAVISKLSALLVFTHFGGLNGVPFALLLAAFIGAGFALARAAKRSKVAMWELIVPSRDDLAVMRRLIRFAQEKPE